VNEEIGCRRCQVAGRSPTKHELSLARTFALSTERLDGREETDRLALDLPFTIIADNPCFRPRFVRLTLFLTALQSPITNGLPRTQPQRGTHA
jgi:hypothetical protein